MNSSIKNRLERCEGRVRFLEWLRIERFLERFNEEQLENYIHNKQFPDTLPAPLPPGKSRLDQLDRKSLIRLWQEHEREWEGRTEQEFNFYIDHCHWAEQPCSPGVCSKTREERLNV
jgi:hypothetical protein